MVHLRTILPDNWYNPIPFFQAKILGITCFSDLMRFLEQCLIFHLNGFRLQPAYLSDILFMIMNNIDNDEPLMPLATGVEM
jgi:hypothetical protein